MDINTNMVISKVLRVAFEIFLLKIPRNGTAIAYTVPVMTAGTIIPKKHNNGESPTIK